MWGEGKRAEEVRESASEGERGWGACAWRGSAHLPDGVRVQALLADALGVLAILRTHTPTPTTSQAAPCQLRLQWAQRYSATPHGSRSRGIASRPACTRTITPEVRAAVSSQRTRRPGGQRRTWMMMPARRLNNSLSMRGSSHLTLGCDASHDSTPARHRHHHRVSTTNPPLLGPTTADPHLERQSLWQCPRWSPTAVQRKRAPASRRLTGEVLLAGRHHERAVLHQQLGAARRRRPLQRLVPV